jgi:hypothetical protein
MPGDDPSLQVDLAEYNALRTEIQTLLNLQVTVLALAAGIVPVVISIAVGQSTDRLPWIVAATPLPFAFLAALYADIAARIGRAANYIQHTLRPRLTRQTAPEDALGWELYVHETDPAKRLLWCTDQLRYLVFFLPAVAAYIVSFRMPALHVWCGWNSVFKIVNGMALLGSLIVVVWSERILKEIASQAKN